MAVNYKKEGEGLGWSRLSLVRSYKMLRYLRPLFVHSFRIHVIYRASTLLPLCQCFDYNMSPNKLTGGLMYTILSQFGKFNIIHAVHDMQLRYRLHVIAYIETLSRCRTVTETHTEGL